MSAVTLKKSLLEAWIGKKIGASRGTLTREQLSQYQLQAVRETICRASESSPFYRTLLKDFMDTEISSFTDLHRFPFTTADDIREHSLQFLCVSQSDVSRIVTLDSSGTTGKAKRMLSTDHVPDAIRQELGLVWKSQVFEHYGMTEMGLGGGIECDAHEGYHLREADLFFEIVDQRGEPVPDGQEGEVVFTTLTRQGMPLIRYRTGDISRFLLDSCSCGTVLRRLDRIAKRKNDLVCLGKDQYFTIADLDEKLFAVSGVLDYTVSVDSVQLATKINISVWILENSNTGIELTLYEAINKVSVIQRAGQADRLSVTVKIICCTTFLPSSVKRRIMELKEADGK